jgi:hypothetical protein
MTYVKPEPQDLFRFLPEIHSAQGRLLPDAELVRWIPLRR